MKAITNTIIIRKSTQMLIIFLFGNYNYRLLMVFIYKARSQELYNYTNAYIHSSENETTLGTSLTVYL